MSGKKIKRSYDVLKKLSQKIITDYFSEVTFDDYEATSIPIYNKQDIEHFFLKTTGDPSLVPKNFGPGVSDMKRLFDFLECTYLFLKENLPDIINNQRHTFFEAEINKFLHEWGYQMKEGEIWDLPDTGMETLVDEEISKNTIPEAEEKIKHAKELFFKHGASNQDKKLAIELLGDLFEHERENFKQMNSKEESAIFNVLNNYGIRHHNESQQEIEEPYLSWAFYALLNTIHTYSKLKAN